METSAMGVWGQCGDDGDDMWTMWGCGDNVEMMGMTCGQYGDDVGTMGMWGHEITKNSPIRG